MHAKERIDGWRVLFEGWDAGMSNAAELLKPPEFHDAAVIWARFSPELIRPFRYLLGAMTKAKWPSCTRQIHEGQQVLRAKWRFTMLQPIRVNRSNGIVKCGALCRVRRGVAEQS
jgi:hypothetical protein